MSAPENPPRIAAHYFIGLRGLWRLEARRFDADDNDGRPLLEVESEYIRADVAVAEVAGLAERAERYRVALQRIANAHLLPAEEELDLDAVVKEAGMALGKLAAKLCPVRGVACPDHGFVHGKEAEELRAGIERLAKEHRGGASKRVTVLCDDLLDLLDEVDARDSLAFLETKEAKP